MAIRAGGCCYARHPLVDTRFGMNPTQLGLRCCALRFPDCLYADGVLPGRNQPTLGEQAALPREESNSSLNPSRRRCQPTRTSEDTSEIWPRSRIRAAYSPWIPGMEAQIVQARQEIGVAPVGVPLPSRSRDLETQTDGGSEDRSVVR